MREPANRTGRLRPDLLPGLPAAVRRPAYDRSALRAGMAHIGVGAFHRSHQAEYTDDLLEQEFGRWGVVGINIRNPPLADMLGAQGGLYTRLAREGSASELRVVGSIVRTVDSQASAAPALEILASAEIEVVTMTVTEKCHCHFPATGELNLDLPEIAADLANPERPVTLPGMLVRALEHRMQTHGRPVTLLSCDNIPANGFILGNVVRTLAERRSRALARWIEANAAFPSAMVDRIAPATTQNDIDAVEQAFGYRDEAVVVCEPFRQWVIEDRFAGRRPAWDRAGASFVRDVTPFEHLKMRVLNGAQTTLCYLGVLAGLEHTFDDMGDPLLVEFTRRMLLEETLPTLEPVPGMDAQAYVEQSFARLRNTAIRHRNHQIATDGSQKIVQRLLSPITERLRRGEGAKLLSVAVAGWMAYLVLASERFGERWKADDPFAGAVAAIADRVGDDVPALVSGILALDAIFVPELAASEEFRRNLVDALSGFLSPDPKAVLRRICVIAA